MEFHKAIPLWMVASMFSALGSLHARNASTSCCCGTGRLLTGSNASATQHTRRLPARLLSPPRTELSRLQGNSINSLQVQALVVSPFFSFQTYPRDANENDTLQRGLAHHGSSAHSFGKVCSCLRQVGVAPSYETIEVPH